MRFARKTIPSTPLAAAREFKPDLILLDFIMPELDGSSLASKFREDPLFKFTPIVFLTAIVSAQDVTVKKTIDGFPCLAKPVTKEKLVECINQNLPA